MPVGDGRAVQSGNGAGALGNKFHGRRFDVVPVLVSLSCAVRKSERRQKREALKEMSSATGHAEICGLRLSEEPRE